MESFIILHSQMLFDEFVADFVEDHQEGEEQTDVGQLFRDLIEKATRPTTTYCPTPSQIAAECRRIRAGWSEDEHGKRAVYAYGCQTNG